MRKCVSCGSLFDLPNWTCPQCGYGPSPTPAGLSFSVIDGGEPSFHPHDFDALPELESRHFWFRSRNRLIQWALNRYVPEAQTFLEVGCGSGYVLAGLREERPDLQLTGTELFLEGLRVARTRVTAAELYRADARRLPFVQEFDAVGAFDVIEHIDEDEDVLSELFHALKPGGTLLLTVPQHPALWSEVDVYSCHRRRYRARDLIAKVERAGFTVLRKTSFVSLLFPLMLAARLRRRPADPLAELRISDRLNRVLEWILGIERRLITRGVSFPFGGSLLLVARRG